MAKITEIPKSCPQCGSDVWDNTKRPKRNPKAPDARCKDKDNCEWAGWLPEAPKSSAGTARKAEQQYPWGPLLKLCVQYTKQEIAPLFQNPTNEMVKELAATLFIAASREGGDIFKKAAPTPAPQPPAPPPAAAPAPQPRKADYDDSGYQADDDLPF